MTLAYVELGDPKGAPLLLLHGYTDTSRSWTQVAPYLLRHRLLIPDQRGHGGSDAPACCYSACAFAEDARLFLDAMKVEKAAVAGHSLGSMVAMTLAAEHPERVTRLALIGSTALVPVKRGDWLWTNAHALSAPLARSSDSFANGTRPTSRRRSTRPSPRPPWPRSSPSRSTSGGA